MKVKKVVFLNGNFRRILNGKKFQAMAVENGIIKDIGTNSKIKPLKRCGYKVLDLRNGSALPAIFDAHLHLLSLGNYFNRVNLDGLSSLEKALHEIKKKAEQASAGKWVLGRGWNKNLWGDKFPDKTVLDNITRNPVALFSKDGHLLWINSTTLQICGINKNTMNPDGGEIERDRFGEPTGILKENAVNIVEEHIPKQSKSEKVASIKVAQNNLLKAGVIGAGDCNEDQELFAIYKEMDSAGSLKLRIFKMIPKHQLDQAIKAGLRTGVGTDHFRTGCLKLFADGALGSQTALMFEAYTGSTCNFGIETLTPAQILELADKALRAGISLAIHAIGDKANFQALNSLGKFVELYKSGNLRPRIEHAQLLRESEIQLFSQYEIIASMQPIHATSDRDTADKYWGTRSRYAYAFKSLLRSGADLAFGSDAPIEDWSPFAGIYAAVTRKRSTEKRKSWYPEEKISLRQALTAYTSGSSRACRFNDITSDFSIGKKADFLVLEDDIFKLKKSEIPGIRPLMTIIDGEIAYSIK